jgi:hypothetical protein
MSLNSYNDPISVIASFRERDVKPLAFKWGGRDWHVKRVNMVHEDRDGRTKLVYFSVSDEANYFKLRFNSETLAWTLEEVWNE